MPRKREYVVRVVTEHNEKADMLLECLRYAQVITIHRNDEQGICFDIYPPYGLDSNIWADMNAERMQSFSFNAVKAPSTRT